jgi:hypothetical protein
LHSHRISYFDPNYTVTRQERHLLFSSRFAAVREPIEVRGRPGKVRPGRRAGFHSRSPARPRSSPRSRLVAQVGLRNILVPSAGLLPEAAVRTGEHFLAFLCKTGRRMSDPRRFPRLRFAPPSGRWNHRGGRRGRRSRVGSGDRGQGAGRCRWRRRNQRNRRGLGVWRRMEERAAKWWRRTRRR